MEDVQVSCYRILTSLYALGTGKNIYVERYFTFKDGLFVWKCWCSSPVLFAVQTTASSGSVSGHAGWSHACSLPGATAQHL